MAASPALQRTINNLMSDGPALLWATVKKMMSGVAVTSDAQGKVARYFGDLGLMDDWRLFLLSVKPITMYSAGTADIPEGFSTYTDPRNTGTLKEAIINVIDTTLGDDVKQAWTAETNNPKKKSGVAWYKWLIGGGLVAAVGFGLWRFVKR